jgi:hypothetical protein
MRPNGIAAQRTPCFTLAPNETASSATPNSTTTYAKYAEESYAFELFRDGTTGLAYLLKDRIGELSRLAEAPRAVAASRSVIDPQVVEALVRGRARLRASALNNLTPRELEVLREMAQGCAATPASPRSCTCPSHRWKTRQRHLHQARLTSEPTSHRRVTAVLTFLRDAGLRC